MARREFQFQQEGSGKFWAIDVEGKTVTVQFGRTGTTGQTQTKKFSSAAEADKTAAKLVAEKLKKGYQEVGTKKKAPAPGTSSGTLVSNCKPDPTGLAVLAECLTGCDFQGTGGEWPGHFFSNRTVAYSCGIVARDGDPVVHAHDRDELKRCKMLAAEAAAIMKDVYIRMGDESDHTLSPFFIPANVGDKVPKKITEDVFRKAMRDIVYPGAILQIEPFQTKSDWWKTQSALHPDYEDVPEDYPDEPERVAKWKHLFQWFREHPDLHSPVYLGFKNQGPEFTSVFPKFFLALTSAGSLVGLVTFVVWT